jgi:hypothetical protein
VVEIPVFARITKFPADPRFTAVGPAANAATGPIRMSAKKVAAAGTVLKIFISFFD